MLCTFSQLSICHLRVVQRMLGYLLSRFSRADGGEGTTNERIESRDSSITSSCNARQDPHSPPRNHKVLGKSQTLSLVWWSGLSHQLEETVESCPECLKHSPLRPEALIPSQLPQLPWQKVGTDLFEWNKSMYLLVVDYYSRWIEVAWLQKPTAAEVINHTCSIYARHGIPEIVVSDNGSQYSADLYATFAREYGFKHVLSSPLYPQKNGEAEKAVTMIKGLLRKSGDPYLALLAYRSTPLKNGYSPAQLLMSRNLRTTLPVAREQRRPKVVIPSELKEREEHLRERQKRMFDHRHRTRDLPQFEPGDTVWIPDRDSPGTVVEETSPRSHIVQTTDGSYQCNRQHLIRLPEGEQTQEVENGTEPMEQEQLPRA